jgi:long-chain fatty acid transport protein
VRFTFSRRQSVVACSVVLGLLASSTRAGGLYVREFGQPSQGTAGTGGGVFAEDASTAFQNPSGLFLLEGDKEWMLTGVLLDSEVEFDPEEGTTIPGSDGGDAGSILGGGALFHTRRMSDDWGLAFSLNSIAGSALEYDDDFVARHQGYDVELLTVLFTPSVAYRFSDTVSVSMGVSIMYGVLDLKAAVPPLLGPVLPERDGLAEVADGDDISATITGSLLWQVSDQTRLGIAYLGENTLDFSGELSIMLPGAGSGTEIDNIATDVEVTFPQVVALSAMTEVSDRLTLTARLAWEEWSALDSVPLTTNTGGAAIPLDWDDTWNVALGLRYQTAGAWNFYTGVGYDDNPTEPANRISILPADEQWRYSAGATYEMKNNRKIGAVITYADLGDARIESSREVGDVVGDFSSNRVIFLGINYSWH